MGCSEETFLGHHQKGSAGKDVVGVSHYAAAVKNRIVTSRGLIKFDSSVLMVTQGLKSSTTLLTRVTHRKGDCGIFKLAQGGNVSL